MKFVKVSSNGWHTLLLAENGDVYVSGENNYGQLGIPTVSRLSVYEGYRKVHNVSNIVDIYTGYYHSILLREDGRVLVAGNNSHIQLGVKLNSWQNSNIREFTEVKGLYDIVKVSTRGNHTLFLDTNGNLIGSGDSQHSQLGGATNEPLYPFRINGEIKDIAVGSRCSVIVSKNGVAYFSGMNNFRKIHEESFKEIATGVRAVFTKGEEVMIVDNFGKLLLLKSAEGMNSVSFEDTGLSNIKDIAFGADCFFVLTKNGDLYANGSNSGGRLSLSKDIKKASYKLIAKSVESVSSNHLDFFIVLKNGEVYKNLADDNYEGLCEVEVV